MAWIWKFYHSYSKALLVLPIGSAAHSGAEVIEPTLPRSRDLRNCAEMLIAESNADFGR